MTTYQKEDVELFTTIKKEIDERADKEEISLNKLGLKVDREALLKKNRDSLFSSLQDSLKKSLSNLAPPFLDQLKKDHPKIYEKIDQAIERFKIEENQSNYETLNAIRSFSKNLLGKKDLEQLHETAELQYSSGFFDIARLYYFFLSFIEASNSENWLLKGISEQQTGFYQDAILSYLTSAQLDLTSILPHLQIIECLLSLDQKESAKEFFKTVKEQLSTYEADAFLNAKITKLEELLQR